jgi:hypothetical protein
MNMHVRWLSLSVCRLSTELAMNWGADYVKDIVYVVLGAVQQCAPGCAG